MNDLIPIRPSRIRRRPSAGRRRQTTPCGFEVKDPFQQWFARRTEGSSFKIGNYFAVFYGIVKHTASGRSFVNYRLAIRMKKHIAMMERTKRGELVRNHFNERELRTLVASSAGVARPALDIAASEKETARLRVICVGDLTASGLYTPVGAVLFKAEAISVLSGKSNVGPRWPGSGRNGRPPRNWRSGSGPARSGSK